MPPAIKSGRRTTGKTAPSKSRTRPNTATKRTPKKKSPVKPSPSKTRSPVQSKSAPRKVVYRYYAFIYQQLPYIIPGLKSARFLEAVSGPLVFELGEENQQLAIAHKLFDRLSNDEGYFVSIYDETKGLVFLYAYKPGVGIHFAAPSPVRNIRSVKEFGLMYWYTEGDNRYVFRFGGDLEPFTSPAYKQTPDPIIYKYKARDVYSSPMIDAREVKSIPSRYTGEPRTSKPYIVDTGSTKLYLGELRSSTPAEEVAQTAEVLKRASDKTQQPTVTTPVVPPATPRRGLFSWLF